jgi:hypothetical protein
LVGHDVEGYGRLEATRIGGGLAGRIRLNGGILTEAVSAHDAIVRAAPSA